MRGWVEQMAWHPMVQASFARTTRVFSISRWSLTQKGIEGFTGLLKTIRVPMSVTRMVRAALESLDVSVWTLRDPWQFGLPEGPAETDRLQVELVPWMNVAGHPGLNAVPAMAAFGWKEPWSKFTAMDLAKACLRLSVMQLDGRSIVEFLQLRQDDSLSAMAFHAVLAARCMAAYVLSIPGNPDRQRAMDAIAACRQDPLLQLICAGQPLQDLDERLEPWAEAAFRLGMDELLQPGSWRRKEYSMMQWFVCGTSTLGQKEACVIPPLCHLDRISAYFSGERAGQASPTEKGWKIIVGLFSRATMKRFRNEEPPAVRRLLWRCRTQKPQDGLEAARWLLELQQESINAGQPAYGPLLESLLAPMGDYLYEAVCSL